jgi:excisionase family DNA binding protein
MAGKLTAREAADILGYHINHVYRLLRSGVMKGEQFNRVWMIDPAEVKRIKAQQDVHGRRYREYHS